MQKISIQGFLQVMCFVAYKSEKNNVSIDLLDVFIVGLVFAVMLPGLIRRNFFAYFGSFCLHYCSDRFINFSSTNVCYCLDLEVTQLDLQGSLLETSCVPPLEQDRLELLHAQMLITILVKEGEDDVNNVLRNTTVGHPLGNVAELLTGHSILLRVQEKHGPLQIRASKEDIVEVLELIKGHSRAVLEGLLHPLQHLGFLL